MAKMDNPGKLSIRNRLRFLAKDAFLYGGAAALNRSFSLITFPLLARHFSLEDFGLIDLFTAAAAVLCVTLVFGQDSAVARYFYEHEDEGARRRIATQSFLFQAGCAAVVLPALWLAAEPAARLLSVSPASGGLLRLVLMQVPALICINFAENLLKWTFARRAYLILSMGAVAVRMAALLAAVTLFHAGVSAVFAVNLAVSGCFGLLGLYLVRGWLGAPGGTGHLRAMLPFALPLGCICALASLSPLLERALVSRFFGEADLGLYAAGAKVALLASMPIQALQMAWGPFSLALHKEPDAAATYNWVLKAVALGLCLFTLLLAAAAGPLISLLASERFAAGAAVVFPLAMGQALQAIGWIPALGISVAKRTSLNLYAYLVYIAVTAVAILALGWAMGPVGIAYAAMAGLAAKSALEAWFGMRAWPIGWELGGVLAVAGATAAIGIAAHAAAKAVDASLACYIPLASLPLVLILGWLGMFGARERSRIKGFILARLQGGMAAG